ncbi:hypothetical protein GCM10022393_19310 [Aquimarina addita]|uniref:Uncharacterized protein n=2 Tax=Aquimarina addita TaxID=870485 RepID=A0ABP6UJZ4_9FLAO
MLFAITNIEAQFDIEETMNEVLVLDKVIETSNPNLMYDHTFDIKKYTKNGNNYEINSYSNKKFNNKIALFGIVVESFQVTIVNDIILFIEIDLEFSNSNVEHIQSEFTKYFGQYVDEVSKVKGSQRKLFYNKDRLGFFINAFLETDLNDGDLTIGYVTKEYIDLSYAK